MTLAQIAQAVGGVLGDGTDGAITVTGPAVEDSRSVQPGGLFAAFVGEQVDGHEYAAAAVERGAAAVLASRQVGSTSSGVVPSIIVPDVQEALGKLARTVLTHLPAATVIGLTGSSGKTSAKDLLGQVLAGHAATIATEGSYNNEIGLPLTVLRADETTRYLVLEMGARGIGHLKYLCEIAPPSVGIVLNIGSAHVGEFGSKEQTALAKGELIEALPPDGVAVLNADDPLVAPMNRRTVARVVTFGESEAADVRAEEITLGPDGRASFLLRVGDVGPEHGGTARVRLQLVGEHHVSNALAAAAAALAVGMPSDRIAERLSAAVPLSGGRMSVTERPDGVVVIDDAYNANPESVRAALKSLAALARSRPGGRAWAVLGAMLELGDCSDEEHDAIGRLAVRLRIDRLVAVGEGAARIHAGASHEGSWGEESVMVADPEAALALLDEQLRPGDVVLVKASKATGLRRVAQALAARGGEGGRVPAGDDR